MKSRPRYLALPRSLRRHFLPFLAGFGGTLLLVSSVLASTAGNITSITDPDGNVTRFEYELTFNRITKIIDALGNVTRFTYDPNGNLITATDPVNNTTTIAYNSFGQPISAMDPLGNVMQFIYDAQGNLITIVDPLGNQTQRVYDAVSRLVSLINPRGFSTQFRYDDLNRLTEIADARQGITRFAYDSNGNLLTVTDAKGQATTYTYDNMDRLLTRTDALGRTERYEYDQNGNLLRFTDRRGQVTTFAYDRLNRRTGATYANGRTRAYEYDAVGRLIRTEDSVSGSVELTYNSLGRLIQELTPQGVIAYTYDALGRRTKMTIAGQAPVTYQYDAASRLIQVAQGSLVVIIGYDAAGRRTSLTYPNGASTSYSYDAASRVTSIVHNGPAGLIESLTYAYDAGGNRTSINRANGPALLLPAAMTAAAYDVANQLIQFNSAILTYDANGNLISDGVNTYTWDALNQLETISGPNLFASFTYDALGRRISKTVGGVTTQFLYDGQDIVAEIQGGAVSVTYLRSLNIDESFVRQSVNGNEYYHVDALGSTLALTNSAGAVTTTYAYEPFGRTQITGTSGNPFQYTGRENDGTGLYYYRARYYSPTYHRFLQEDPIGFAGGDVNLYGYVLGNPVSWIDPLGLKLCALNLSGLGNTYLDDSVAPLVEDFIRRSTASGIDVTFTEAFRPTEYQEALTRNPNAITPAPSGTSLHEAGFAFDVSWRRIPPGDRRTVVENARQAGLRWGGNFKKPDPVHFYKEVLGGRAKRAEYIKQAQGEFKKGDVPTCP